MQKRYLLAPGPTAVPSEVLMAMSRPMIHHRSADFEPVVASVREDLKWIFQTTQDVMIIASSGTGGMEAAVSNFLSPGEKAITINGGKFGERWTKLCKAYGIQPQEIKVEWGRAVDPNQVSELLKKDPSIKAVFVQASESSTGVAHDVRKLGEMVKGYPDTILVVDAVSALGVFDLKTDAWGLDVVISGSQKALMLPPGLAFVSASEKAWQKLENAKSPRFYFDLKRERDNLKKNTTAYTPAISLILGLQEAFRMIKPEGLQGVFDRHQRLAHATREAMKSLGLELLPKESPSNALTAVMAPTGYDGQTIYKNLRDQYGITSAGGQDHLKGEIFRISHMGYADTFDVITAVAATEMVLKGMGHPLKLGTGVGVAQELLLKK
ncbi:MAG TPA: alanine--glyoxylate aminotransferase family protein [Nitrospiria bacterium]